MQRGPICVCLLAGVLPHTPCQAAGATVAAPTPPHHLAQQQHQLPANQPPHTLCRALLLLLRPCLCLCPCHSHGARRRARHGPVAADQHTSRGVLTCGPQAAAVQQCRGGAQAAAVQGKSWAEGGHGTAVGWLHVANALATPLCCCIAAVRVEPYSVRAHTDSCNAATQEVLAAPCSDRLTN